MSSDDSVVPAEAVREPPVASVVITTRNRCESLRQSLRSCEMQVDVHLEILVYDDASADGTQQMIKSEFPSVRYIRCDRQVGYIRLRNQGCADARGKYIFSVDDDAEFTGERTMSRIVHLFSEFPNAAAIALPFVEPNRTVAGGGMAESALGTPLRSFTGCAHAVRCDVFLSLGGYPEILVHQGEERDFCIRLLDSGHDILYADTMPVVHHVSERRERRRIDYYAGRNALLFVWMRFPLFVVVPRMLLTTIRLIKYKFRFATLPHKIHAVAAGYACCLRFFGERRPVGRRTYQRFERLPRHGPQRMTGLLGGTRK